MNVARHFFNNCLLDAIVKGGQMKISRYFFSAMLMTIFTIVTAPAIKAQALSVPSKNWGLSIGNSQDFTGLRINFRDKHIGSLRGVNMTFWKPAKNYTGNFTGLGLGVVGPAAEHLNGIMIGGVAVQAKNELHGLSVGLIAVGAGERVQGINIGGIAAGAGGELRGLNIGGFAVGAGEDVFGINIGGFACGAGESLRGFNVGGFACGAGEDLEGFSIAIFACGAGKSAKGITIGGFACGAGEDVRGITLGGFAVGAGEDMTGISASLFAAGAGGDVNGFTVSGFAVGAGEGLNGISMAGIAVGAPDVTGFVTAPFVGCENFKGIALAPLYFRMKDGDFKGVSLSTFNKISGTQRGLNIGIINFARELKGAQLGVLNIALSNPGWARFLPVFNKNFQ